MATNGEDERRNSRSNMKLVLMIQKFYGENNYRKMVWEIGKEGWTFLRIRIVMKGKESTDVGYGIALLPLSYGK